MRSLNKIRRRSHCIWKGIIKVFLLLFAVTAAAVYSCSGLCQERDGGQPVEDSPAGYSDSPGVRANESKDRKPFAPPPQFSGILFRAYYEEPARFNQSEELIRFDLEDDSERFRKAAGMVSTGFPFQPRLRNWNSWFWRNMSVRYVELPRSVSRADMKLLERDKSSQPYELIKPLPLFYFQDRWVTADDNKQLQALLNYDLAACGYCPGAVWDARPSPDQLPVPPPLGEKEWIAHFTALQDCNPVLSVDISKAGRIELEVEISQPGMLVTAVPSRPGWRVTVDGKEEKLSRVNYLQGGIWCSPGKHRIVMESPAAFRRNWDSWFRPEMSVSYAGLPCSVSWAEMKLREQYETFQISELNKSLPRFYFQDRWVTADKEKQLQALLNYDLRDCGYCPGVVWDERPSADRLLAPPPLSEREWIAGFASLQDRNSVLSVDVSQPGRIELEVEISQPGMLVTTVPYHSSWRVLVDGREEKLNQVNYRQGGVWCSPGKHRIVMELPVVLRSNWDSWFWPNVRVRYAGLSRPVSRAEVKLLEQDETSQLYELLNPLPRFYFQDRWVTADDDSQLRALLNYNLGTCGYCSGVVRQTRPSPDQLLSPPPLGEEEWRTYFASLQDRNPVLSVDISEPGRIELEVEISQPGMLVMTDPYRPGWRVTVDGKKEKLNRVNYLQGGVWCSPGKHRIVMELSVTPRRANPVTVFYGLVSILILALSGWILCRAFRAGTLVEYSVSLFTFMTGQIVIGGIVLSRLNLLGSIFYWCLFNASVLLCLLAAILFSRSFQGRVFGTIAFSRLLSFFKELFSGVTIEKQIALAVLLLTTVVLGLLNAAVIIGTAPSHWDSMVFHLARVGYWLQHNNFDYYDANICFQVTHQKLKSILLLFVFLATGRNENLTQLVQFCAYWVAVFSIYGISRLLGLKSSAALFTALIFSLLTECLMQSTTPQSDMLLTAYLGSILYLVLSFKNTRQRKFLFMAGINIGLALGTKPPAFLALPALLVVIGYLFYADRRSVTSRLRDGALLALVSLSAFGVFAVPTGYWANYRVFGHPLGPESLREYHSFEGRNGGYILVNGTKNVFRYCSDFLSLDGFPPVPIINRFQSLLKTGPRFIFSLAGIQLEAEEGEGTREGPFIFNKPPYSHADYSYWGIFGFALIWPAVFLTLIGLIRFPAGRVFSIATILFLLLQAYSGPYEPNRGRYFIAAAVFAVPAAGYLFLSKNKFVRGYLLLIVALGYLSALTAVLFRYRSPVLTRESVFFQDRLSQVLRNGPVFQTPIRNFEEVVPPDAVVAVCLNPNSFEYPLFDAGLTRTIIPLNSFWRGLQPVPENADYLLWAEDFDDIFDRNESDIFLGKDWYLRKLK